MTSAEMQRADELMPELQGIEVPNLDDYSVDPMDWAALERLFDLLSLYCSQKRAAMQYRLKGDCEVALAYERMMQRTYERLPAWARW